MTAQTRRHEVCVRSNANARRADDAGRSGRGRTVGDGQRRRLPRVPAGAARSNSSTTMRLQSRRPLDSARTIGARKGLRAPDAKLAAVLDRSVSYACVADATGRGANTSRRRSVATALLDARIGRERGHSTCRKLQSGSRGVEAQSGDVATDRSSRRAQVDRQFADAAPGPSGGPGRIVSAPGTVRRMGCCCDGAPKADPLPPFALPPYADACWPMAPCWLC